MQKFYRVYVSHYHAQPTAPLILFLFLRVSFALAFLTSLQASLQKVLHIPVDQHFRSNFA